MSLLDIFRIRSKPKGIIGYFGLTEWWKDTFSEFEREYIGQRFQPIGEPPGSLTRGYITSREDTVVSFLRNLAGWFTKDKDRHLAYKLLDKAEELIPESTKTIDAHFLYQSKIMIAYMDRDKPGGLEKAIIACKQQIKCAREAAIAFKNEHIGETLPGHKGYQQLIIILEEEKKFSEAIKICTEAMEQGWFGDWEQRIKRYKQYQNS